VSPRKSSLLSTGVLATIPGQTIHGCFVGAAEALGGLGVVGLRALEGPWGWAGASPLSFFHSTQSEREVREEIYTGGVRPGAGSLVTCGEHHISLAH
jgi:hypothetical protein